MSNSAKTILGFLLLLTLVGFSYRDHFANGFYFDDTHTIQNNLAIRSLDNVASFFTDPRTSSALPPNQSFRPLVTLSLALDYAATGGLNPQAFHASTFIVYLLLLAFFYLLARRIIEHSASELPSHEIALAASALYGLHTANAETINYIIARSDVLSTFFVVIAVYAFTSPSLRRWQIYLIPAVLGMLSKEAALVCGGLLAAYTYLIEPPFSSALIDTRGILRASLRAMPALLCAVVIFSINKHLATSWVPGGNSSLLYLATQPWVICHYLLSFFAPLWLNADTDWTVVSYVMNWRTLLGSVVLITLILAGLKCRLSPKWRPVGFGLAWFLIALVPSSSVVPLSEVLNDHRTFFPYLGLSLAICCACVNLATPIKLRNKPFIVLALAGIFLGHSLGVQARTKVWSSDYSLWLDVTQKSPNNGRGLMNFGLTLMSQGDLVGAKKYFERTAQLLPNYPYVYINLAVLNGNSGNDREAESQFLHAKALAPGLPEAYFYYARFLFLRSRLQESETLLRQCIDLSPSYLYPRQLLLALLEKQSRWEELKRSAQEILLLDSQDSTALWYLKLATQRTASS
ncbi:MAG: hypothetical protein K1X79_02160 [Oligoflexia bacterium]|nr:hypothetical protein [Oligoflexia bacterium]